MNASVEAARLLLTGYGNDIRQVRVDTGSSRTFAFEWVEGLTGFARLSAIELGEAVPTETEQTLIFADCASLIDASPGLDRSDYPVLFPSEQDTDSARFTDPNQSHSTVRAITSNTGLHTHIVEYATERYPQPFDVWDTVAWLSARHPRTDGAVWQRGTINRALGRVAGKGLIRFAYRSAQFGRATPTNHYIHNPKGQT